MSEIQSQSAADGHFANYSEYSKTLRAWLVAYGIGGPVLFLTNEKLADDIRRSSVAGTIVTLFLFGVGLQIANALINKWAAWHIYRGELDPAYQNGLLYQIWDWINEQSWIDFWCDFASIVVFIYATGEILRVMLVSR